MVVTADTTQSQDIDLEKLDFVMLLYWDVSWILIGGLIAGPLGAFVGIMIASTAFIIWGDDLMGHLENWLN